MSIPDKLKEHINNQDIIAIRIMLKNRITSDPTFKEFDELDNYIKNKTDINIYQEYDRKEFETDIKKWNKDYLNTECVRLVTNFSKERVNHLRKVCKVVYKERIDSINRERNDFEKKTATDKGNHFAPKDIEEKIHATTKPYVSTTKGKSTIIAVGSAAVAITGIVIEKTALILAGTIMAVGDIVLTVLDKKDKK